MINWTKAHSAYLSNGLSKAAFHRTRLHEFLEAEDAMPDIWRLYHQFHRIEKQTLTPVPRLSSKLIKVVGELRLSVTARVPAESRFPHVPVQLELPGGARLTFATEASEIFAAALIRMTSEFVR